MTGPKIGTKRQYRPIGINVSVYLNEPLHAYVERAAASMRETAPTWIRNLILDHAPEDVAAEARALLKPDTNSRRKPGRPRKDEEAPSPLAKLPESDFEALVSANRDRVHELESRGYLPTQIAATTRLPYKVVEHILTTKAAPKKGMKS